MTEHTYVVVVNVDGFILPARKHQIVVYLQSSNSISKQTLLLSPSFPTYSHAQNRLLVTSQGPDKKAGLNNT